MNEALAAGAKHLFEVVTATILTSYAAVQAWLITRSVKHGERLTGIEAAQITRADLERLEERHERKLDELRESNNATVRNAFQMLDRNQRRLFRAAMKEQRQRRG